MTDKQQEQGTHEPAGLGPHRHGPAAENAQEQGWGTNEEQRAQSARDDRSTFGGTDYDYGAADFGDVPTNERDVQPSPQAAEYLRGSKESDTPNEPPPQTSDRADQ